MRFVLLLFLFYVLESVCVAAPAAPWRTVASSGGAKQIGSYKGCVERANKGPDDNEVLYLTKNDGETVHFVCEKNECGSDTHIAVLGRGCIRNGDRCADNQWFKCDISVIDDSWMFAFDNRKKQVLKPCTKAGDGYFLKNLENSHLVIVAPNDRYQKIHENYYVNNAAGGGVCLAYTCDNGFVFNANACQKIICESGTTRSSDCGDIDNADKCTYKCVGGTKWKFVSLDRCKTGYRLEGENCVVDIKAGDECDKEKLPQFAATGKYIYSGGELKCVATACQAGKYLVVNSNGVSQGWCVAARYCQTTKKMADNCRLKIVDENKTDLTCECADESQEDIDEKNPERDEDNEEGTEEQAQVPSATKQQGGNDDIAESDAADAVTSEGNTSNGAEQEDVREPSAVDTDESANVDSEGQPPVADDVTSEEEESVRTALETELAMQQSEQKVEELRENAKRMKDEEQSAVNKLLGAAGIGATGVGGMMLSSGLAEQKADEDAENAMRAYLATFICIYGDGKNIRGGETNIELPGGNDLLELKTEYIALARDLKQRKEQLEMAPGIEENVILDAATSGLYDDVAVGKTDGAFTSLSRALLDEDGDDGIALEQQKSNVAQKIKTGGVLGGVGAAGSMVGDLLINSDAE